jgi:hypothetical protein
LLSGNSEVAHGECRSKGESTRFEGHFGYYLCFSNSMSLEFPLQTPEAAGAVELVAR